MKQTFLFLIVLLMPLCVSAAKLSLRNVVAMAICLATMTMFASCDSNMKESDRDCIADKYVYPVQPSSDEWKKLDSHQAMVDACQIPQKTLKNLCTAPLVDACLDYPLLFTIFAFDHINQGLEQVSQEFNGFAELFDRDDSGSVLLLKYASIHPEDINNEESNLDRGLFMRKLQYFELTLGFFEPIRNKLTHQERVKIIEDGLHNLGVKEKNNYSNTSKVSNFYMIVKMLEAEKYPPFMEYVNGNNHWTAFLSGDILFYNYEIFNSDIKQIIEEYLTN